MSFFQNLSIRAKLLLIMLLSGIPIFLVFLYFLGSQYLDKRNAAEHSVLSAVQSIAFEHTAQVEGMRSLLIALSQYPEIRRKDAAGSSKILNLILEKSPSSLNVGVADRYGNIIATGLKQPLPIAYTIGDRKYFRDAVRTKRFSAGEYSVSRSIQKTVTLHFALPVLDRRGDVDLVLYAAYNMASFRNIFTTQDLPFGSILNLTDHNGKVLFRFSKLALEDLNGQIDKSELRRHMIGVNEEGVLSGVGMDGTRRHFAYKRLRLSPADPPYLYIRVSIPEAVATANTRRAMEISLAVFLIATGLTLYLSRIIGGRYLAAPLQQLVEATERVEEGDLSARSGLPYTGDEIGRLARSFDDMTLSLDERIREISRNEAEKHRLAYYDPLTTLPNRRLLRERLDLALVRCRRQRTSFALLYIDVDNFKNINDSLGHSAGDSVLKVIATRYAAIIREDDVVCRMGGDEFAIVLHDINHPIDVTLIVERLLAATAAPLVLDGRELLVTASIGIALYPKDAEDTGTLERDADIALYNAKDEGKNTFRMFSEELNRSSHERIQLVHALQHAMEKNELSLHYQPKISNGDGRIIGVEALLRWNSEELGAVTPDRFIPLAEESRLIMPIGEWVLRTACRQQVAWREQGLDLCLAVNISAVQLKSPHLIETVQAIIEETGIVPEQLELELTESSLVDKPEEVTRILERLRGLKCNIAIDDFGVGYSSLSYLKNFPVTVLKIDRSFVKDLSHNSSDRAIAQSVVDLANNLNMVTVAEGVEHPDQQRILEEIGCSYVQGYLHCRPVPPEQIPGIVRERNGAAPAAHAAGGLEVTHA
ncbi:bifunctional diguanylate cyclase/phosphodiesterase [Geomesophilobacter sediminis]|uniref:EAL domain-containing protein n=1 Tax=Geomesophilobacter sediminis TaxID=2798584 RepID=A0A8J7IKY9_9BACT|nr:EAL domain-containing protein [Geomesophilobacter sediminis]MBJ6723348.1 EAL domain-containing protein [Geomesophilobacter sediminis]